MIVASRGGDDHHPAWFLNLREHPQVEVAMKGSKRPMLARRRDARGAGASVAEGRRDAQGLRRLPDEDRARDPPRPARARSRAVTHALPADADRDRVAGAARLRNDHEQPVGELGRRPPSLRPGAGPARARRAPPVLRRSPRRSAAARRDRRRRRRSHARRRHRDSGRGGRAVRHRDCTARIRRPRGRRAHQLRDQSRDAARDRRRPRCRGSRVRRRVAARCGARRGTACDPGSRA